MKEFLKYLDETVLKTYLNKLSIDNNLFYVLCDYKSQIKIICLSDINLLSLFVDNNLYYYFKYDIISTIRSYKINIKIIDIFNDKNNLVIKYTYNNNHKLLRSISEYRDKKSKSDIIKPQMIEEEYISKRNPIRKINELNFDDILTIELNNYSNNSKGLKILNNLENVNNIITGDDKLILHVDKYMIKIGEWDDMGKFIFHDGFINNELNKMDSINFVKYIDMVIADKIVLNIEKLNVSNIIIEDAVILITKYIYSISLEKFIKISNIKDFYLILTQIIFCLYTSFNKIQFVHFDLHAGNIIIEKKENTLIEYEDMSLTSNYIVKIFDYEYSHILFKGLNIGIDSQQINIYNKNFWIHDIFKILMSIYGIVLKKKREYMPIIEKILSFFVEKMDENIFLKYQNINSYYNLRYFKSDANYEDFISFFKKEIVINIKNNIILKNDSLDIKNYICD